MEIEKLYKFYLHYTFAFFRKLLNMDVFLMVRRKKTTIFLDAKESSTVLDLKKMIEGITKKTPADQQLFNKEDTGMELVIINQVANQWMIRPVKVTH